MGDFNARLYDRQPGDDDVIGEFIFRSKWPKRRKYLNRDLLLETCRATSSAIANAFFELPPEELVTYYGTEVDKTSPVGEGFAQIDHLFNEPRNNCEDIRYLGGSRINFVIPAFFNAHVIGHRIRHHAAEAQHRHKVQEPPGERQGHGKFLLPAVLRSISRGHRNGEFERTCVPH